MPKVSASSGVTRPRGMGRLAVRCMRASMSASYHMLSAPDAPAPTAMQSSAMTASTGCSVPGASTMPASAVNTTSDITRGFISARKSPTLPPAAWAGRSAAGLVNPTQPWRSASRAPTRAHDQWCAVSLNTGSVS